MKKVLILALAIMTCAVPATAGVTTFTSPQEGNPDAIWPGWNLISIPGIPLNPDPPTIFGSIPISPNKLFRFDAATKSFIAFDEWTPYEFGGMLLTDGYWLLSTAACRFSYEGLDDNETMDVWVSLPKTGWTLMGNPFNREYYWADTKVTDGNITVSLEDAGRTHNWLSTTAWWWDAQSQSLGTLGLPDDFPSAESMAAWHGYWVESYVDKIALIFESP
ncbi:MAG: hypothetical protein QME62_12225 [Armatimonadota bacterium]|nr:hypothetical protein [Armatimonadota bacterium]